MQYVIREPLNKNKVIHCTPYGSLSFEIWNCTKLHFFCMYIFCRSSEHYLPVHFIRLICFMAPVNLFYLPTLTDLRLIPGVDQMTSLIEATRAISQ